MEIVLNKIGIWGPCGAAKLNKRLCPIGQKYLLEGDAAYRVTDKPLYRYAKDYSRKKGNTTVKFCLLVRTASEDVRVVEPQLDALAKKLEAEEILQALSSASLSSFTYTDAFIKETK